MSSPTAANTPAPDAAPETPGFDFLTWLEVNRRAVGGGLAVVIVVVVGVMFVRWRAERHEADANHALLALSAAVNPQTHASAADLERVAADFKGTHAAERAKLMAAGELFREGKFSEAQDAFSRFNTDFPESEFGGIAALGVATSLDALGRTNQAVDAYQRVITGFSSDPAGMQARLGKGRLAEASGQASQALSLYEEVLKNPAAGALGQLAAVSRSALISRHPELEAPSVSAVVTNSVNVAPPRKP